MSLRHNVCGRNETEENEGCCNHISHLLDFILALIVRYGVDAGVDAVDIVVKLSMLFQWMNA